MAEGVQTAQSASEAALDWESVLARRTEQVDQATNTASRAFLKAVLPLRVAIAAVGGYGRCELFPHSDIDLLILVESEDVLGHIRDPLSEMLRILWDGGLRVSQSARTVGECCRLNDGNIELHISLLDTRWLCGDEALFSSFEQQLHQFYRRSGPTPTSRLAEMTSGRHTKFNDTIYHLEPNIKETPGGIRDIHFLGWLSLLMDQNEALREARDEIKDARSFFYQLRVYLHRTAGRDNNLLSFELQDQAARDLGANADPAEWMRRYYQFARQTWQAARRALEYANSLDTSLLKQLRDRRSRLSNTDYTVSRDRIFLRNPSEALGSPESVFRLFSFSARHGLRLSWETERRIRAGIVSLEAKFTENAVLWPAWSELLNQPHASLALHEMQETGVLMAAIPEWKAVDSLVVRDFYHRYTVDEHSIVAIKTIDDLAADSGGPAKRVHQLLKEAGDLAVLRFALLLHDIGKGTKPGQHVEGSLEVAAQVMDRLNVPALHQKTISLLIEHHLDLSLVMNGRDLDDPATARFLALSTKTLEHLRYLTLLTFADISAVNPTAMTPWRIEQLMRVYAIGIEQLTRELETDRIHGFESLPPEERTPEFSDFLEGLPTRYLRVHSQDEIRHQVKLKQHVETHGVAVEIVPQKGVFLATVLAPDKPGLFGSLCGTLASFGMNIVKAEAFTNAAGLVVDQFRFTDPLRSLELNPSEVDRLRRTMERVTQGAEDVRALLKRRRPPARPSRVAQLQPVVRFNNEASDTATLVEFIGEDRPGLLYDLASAFTAECNIELVLIDTEAHKAIDVFYVTCQGDKLDEQKQQVVHTALLKAADPS